MSPGRNSESSQKNAGKITFLAATRNEKDTENITLQMTRNHKMNKESQQSLVKIHDIGTEDTGSVDTSRKVEAVVSNILDKN